MRTGLVVISDLHVGSIDALCPPGMINLKHGGKYYPTAVQNQLWDWWLDFAKNIPSDVDEWHLILNGDIVEGVSSRSHLIIRPTVSFQTDLAIEVISALLEAAPSEPASIYATRGTPWHTGQESDQEILVTDALGCVPDPTTGASAYWNLDLEVQGKLFNFKHHPATFSMVPDLQAVAVSRLAKRIYDGRVRDGHRVPDVAVRSHVHVCKDSGYNPPEPRVHTTPCWKIGFDDYTSKKGFEQLPDLGGLFIITDDNDIVIRRQQYTFDEDPPCQV